MSGSFTSYGRQQMLACTFLGAEPIGFTQVALTLVIPGTADDVQRLVEPTAGAYDRVYYMGGWQAGQPGEVFNREVMTFVTPTADWGAVRGWALLNESGEHVFAAGALRQATIIKLGMAVTIEPFGLRAVLR
jgi:hypothetical protein